MSKDPRKWIIAAVLAIIFLICFSPELFFNRPDPESVVSRISLVSLIKRVDPSVVYVEAVDDYGDRLWSGSGVIICPDGLVLTAGHVVEETTAFKVVLPDGQEFWSNKSYYSDITDVGLIRIDAEKLPFSYLGNSDDLCKGEKVFIMGSPFGYNFRNAVTAGIISGLERDFDGFFGEKLLLRVDAASHPGNSGGPVFNMQGRIIGILVGGMYGNDDFSIVVPIKIIKLVLMKYQAIEALKNAK